MGSSAQSVSSALRSTSQRRFAKDEFAVWAAARRIIRLLQSMEILSVWFRISEKVLLPRRLEIMSVLFSELLFDDIIFCIKLKDDFPSV
jgi:hypothetical protein